MTDPYPKWARWIAQDRDGNICVFNYRPGFVTDNLSLTGDGWWHPQLSYYDNGQLIYSDSKCKRVARGKPNPHWRHSLDCLGDGDEPR